MQIALYFKNFNRMKQFYIFTLLFLIPILSKAQFPAFANFEGSRIYVDSSASTKPFRDKYAVGDRIDAALAHHIAEAAIHRENIYIRAIEITTANPKISWKQKNEVITALQDSITFIKEVRNYYSSINKFAGIPGWKASILPVTRAAHSRFFYQGSQSSSIDFLSNFILQSNLEKTAISSDLITGALSVFQVTLSTTVNDNSDTTAQEIVNNKLLYGALLNGRLTYPLLFKANRHIAVYMPISIKGSIDNVAVNDEKSTDDTFYFSEASTSLYLRLPIRYTSSENNVSFFTNAKLGCIFGGSKFYDKLESINNAFVLSQATVGIEVDNKFRIALNIPIYSSQKSITDNSATTIGIQVDPKFLSSN